MANYTCSLNSNWTLNKVRSKKVERIICWDGHLPPSKSAWPFPTSSSSAGVARCTPPPSSSTGTSSQLSAHISGSSWLLTRKSSTKWPAFVISRPNLLPLSSYTTFVAKREGPHPLNPFDRRIQSQLLWWFDLDDHHGSLFIGILIAGSISRFCWVLTSTRSHWSFSRASDTNLSLFLHLSPK